ncbi:hypothetical protein QOZ80_3BG0258350 [Eleusine coracana subsp. coracana]|nr:hypothetical protein QOZ80_3BG0258350 [Eleusine coracana subsp. coracana]
MAMPSSEASSSPSKRGGLRGPRPQPLKVTSSSRGSSTASKPSSSRKAPVIVYENTPKVVHARPQEFMTVVQRLTGKPTASFSTASAAGVEEGGDHLLLTLGQRPAVPTPMAAGGLLMSPSFIFSPNTMQSIQELSSLF